MDADLAREQNPDRQKVSCCNTAASLHTVLLVNTHTEACRTSHHRQCWPVPARSFAPCEPARGRTLHAGGGENRGEDMSARAVGRG